MSWTNSTVAEPGDSLHDQNSGLLYFMQPVCPVCATNPLTVRPWVSQESQSPAYRSILNSLSHITIKLLCLSLADCACLQNHIALRREIQASTGRSPEAYDPIGTAQSAYQPADRNSL